MATLRLSSAPRLAALAVAAAIFCSTAAAAQEPAPPRVRVGAGLGVGLIVGEEGSDFLDGGMSRWLGGTFRLDGSDRLHVHVEGGQLALEPDEDPAGLVHVENSLTFLAVGPQVSITLGRLRPYLTVLGGVAVAAWEIEEDGAIDDERSGSESSLGWGGRAGLAFDVDRGDHPVSFLAEAWLLDPGALQFARAQTSTTGQRGGTTHADVAVLSIRVGVTLGF